jgi:hypothetical protein
MPIVRRSTPIFRRGLGDTPYDIANPPLVISGDQILTVTPQDLASRHVIWNGNYINNFSPLDLAQVQALQKGGMYSAQAKNPAFVYGPTGTENRFQAIKDAVAAQMPGSQSNIPAVVPPAQSNAPAPSVAAPPSSSPAQSNAPAPSNVPPSTSGTSCFKLFGDMESCIGPVGSLTGILGVGAIGLLFVFGRGR